MMIADPSQESGWMPGRTWVESARIQRICARRKFSSRYRVHMRVNGRGWIEHQRPAPRAIALPGGKSLEPDSVSRRTRPSMTCTTLA